MSCKDIKKTDTNKRVAASTATVVYDYYESPSKPSEIEGKLESEFNDRRNGKKGIDNPKDKTLLSETNLTISDRALAISRRKIVVDSFNYGPSEKDRTEGLELDSSDSEIRDNFRFTIGRYWTKENNNLKYLNEAKGAAYKVENWNFDNKGSLKTADVMKEQELISDDFVGDFEEFFEKEIDQSEKETFFGTQQWVLIKANSPFYIMNSLNENSTAKKATSKSGMTPSNSQTNKNDFSDRSFSEELWKNYIVGGKREVKWKTVPRDSNELRDLFSREISRRARRKTQPTAATATAIYSLAFDPAISPNVDFFDHCFEIDTPFSEKEIKEYSGLNRPLTAKIDLFYNFLIKKYEKSLPEISERILPNLYVLMSEMKDESNNEFFQDLITLAGSISMNDTPNAASNHKMIQERRDVEVKNISGQYFDKVGREYEKINRFTNSESEKRSQEKKKEKLKELEDRFSVIGLPLQNVEILKKYDRNKRMFPMYADIEFSTDKTTVMAEVLRASLLGSTIMKKIMIGESIQQGFEERTFVEMEEQIQRIKNELGGVINKKNNLFSKTKRRTWFITDLLKDIEKDKEEGESNNDEVFVDYENYDIGVFLGEAKEEINAASEKHYKFFRALMKLIFVGKLKKIVKQKFRTFEQMMSGKLAYSETVLYKIEKSLADKSGKPTGPIIQTFYLPNSNDIDVLNFVDTQVKYNVKYSYRIIAYQAVIGTKYRYNEPKVKGSLATFLVTQAPSIMLVEVPYHSFSGVVLDNPPVFPQLELVPYRGIKDKIMMLFSTNAGDYELDPITIEPGDIEKIKRIREAKNLDEEEKIRYRTDDHSGVFQVFRIEKHPKGYEDFAGNLIAAVNTDVTKATPQEASAATYIDKIEPNKKYYYIFRVVDVHGHISNPTELYRIEMVDDNGSVYPIIERVDFLEDTAKMPVKAAKKYVQIVPTLAQTLIDEEKTGTENRVSAKEINNVFLGVNEEKVWGKNFKVRLVSKKTGKKVDINVDFTTRHVRIQRPEEQ